MAPGHMSAPTHKARLTAAQRRRRCALRRALSLAAVALVAGLLVLGDRAGTFGRAPGPDAETYDGGTFRVIHVVDGDTLDVDTPDALNRRHATRIRLWGVDTPETVKPQTPVQHFGPEAAAFVKRSCSGKEVRLELVKARTRDKYKRLLAYVYLPGGKGLNAELIAQGLGYADPRYDHPRLAEFKRLQHQARRDRRGLWKDVSPTDLPYYYRQGPHKLDSP